MLFIGGFTKILKVAKIHRTLSLPLSFSGTCPALYMYCMY